MSKVEGRSRRKSTPSAPSGGVRKLPVGGGALEYVTSFKQAVAGLHDAVEGAELPIGRDPARVEIGIMIRRARTNKSLTQVQLADAAGIAQAFLSDIERGKGTEGPSIRILTDIFDALGMNLAAVPKQPGNSAALREVRAFGGRVQRFPKFFRRLVRQKELEHEPAA